ncbi:MAG: hypothetical protein E7001_02990 [Coriobacteriaceae bacterium]|nr:hypothetical protein [Coriobacteriaceae bacterium]
MTVGCYPDGVTDGQVERAMAPGVGTCGTCGWWEPCPLADGAGVCGRPWGRGELRMDARGAAGEVTSDGWSCDAWTEEP